MLEIDVTLTDYAIMALCVWWVIRLSHIKSRNRLKNYVTLLYVLVGLGALLGGTSHGFFEDQSTTLYRTVWSLTLFLLGGSSACCAMITLLLAPIRRSSINFEVIILGALIAYTFVILFVTQSYWIVIAANMLALLSLFLVCARHYTQSKDASYAYISMGVILSVVAGLIQFFQISLHPNYFNHNALYHVVEAVGLYLLFLGFVKRIMVYNHE